VTRFNGPRIRRRNVDDVIEEWNDGPKGLLRFIVDDNFFGLGRKDGEWAKVFCEALVRRGRKRLWFSQTTLNMGDDREALELAYRAGCRVMLIGLESFNEGTLKGFKKRLNCRHLPRYRELVDAYHRAGIAVYGAFIIGGEEDTTATAGETLRLAMDIGVDVVQMTTLTPLPGTELFDEFRRSGRLRRTDFPEDWKYYTFMETVFEPKRMTAAELDASRWHTRWRDFRHPHTVLQRVGRTLWRTRSLSTSLMTLGMNQMCHGVTRFFRDRDRPRFQHNGTLTGGTCGTAVRLHDAS